MTISHLYDFFLKYPHVSTDSRRIEAGSLFFALKGDNFDGNRFASTVLKEGAAFAVVDDPAVVDGERYLLVENVLVALQQLAAFHRTQLRCPIIGITGTNGKTTTKELVAAVLATKYRVEYTRGNLNNHIGVPLTLLSMTPETEVGIVEMGANHPGEIAFLCGLARPDYGLVTNVGKAHLEGFGSFEGVVRTKSELYRFLEENGGAVFVNGENEILLRCVGNNLKKITYGTSDDFYLRGEAIDAIPFLNVKAFFQDVTLNVETKLAGGYNLENVLAAMAVGKYFDVAPENVKSAIEAYVPSNNRSQYIRTSRNEIILDAYNANPGSMQASIANFLKLSHPRKLFVLGDMLELGEAAPEEHQHIIDSLSEEVNKGVLLAGPLFSATGRPDGFLVFLDVEGLIEYLRDNPLSGCLVLVKGSRGMQLEKLTPFL